VVQIIFHVSSDWLNVFTLFYFISILNLFLIFLIAFFMHCKNLIFSHQYWIIKDWALLFFSMQSFSSHDPSHGYKMLAWVDINFFCKFFTPNFFSSFKHSTLILLKKWVSLFFFYMLSMRMSQPHNLGHKFVVLARIWLGIFFHFSISFFYFL